MMSKAEFLNHINTFAKENNLTVCYDGNELVELGLLGSLGEYVIIKVDLSKTQTWVGFCKQLTNYAQCFDAHKHTRFIDRKTKRKYDGESLVKDATEMKPALKQLAESADKRTREIYKSYIDETVDVLPDCLNKELLKEMLIVPLWM